MAVSPPVVLVKTKRYSVFHYGEVLGTSFLGGSPEVKVPGKPAKVTPGATQTDTEEVKKGSNPVTPPGGTAYPRTDRLYMLDTYLMVAEATVLGIVEDPTHGHALVLNRTVFHPQGGGQPSDEGFIRGASWLMSVKALRDVGGVIYHYGEFSDGTPSPGEIVSLSLDASKRELHAVLHSAGHAIDQAVRAALGDGVLSPLKGYHFADSPYVEYQGILPQGLEKDVFVEKLNKEMKHLVEADIVTTVNFLKQDQVAPEGGETSSGKASGAATRIVTVAGLACPCGGTHVRSTSQLQEALVTKVKAKKGTLRVSYALRGVSGG